jgi:hypothetical protein
LNESFFFGSTTFNAFNLAAAGLCIFPDVIASKISLNIYYPNFLAKRFKNKHKKAQSKERAYMKKRDLNWGIDPMLQI